MLTPDRRQIAPGWDHVDYVTATVVDANGIVVPEASNLITFAVRGPGSLAAVGNGDNTSYESFEGNNRSAYEGRCVAFIRTDATHGAVVVTASSPGLRSGTVSLAAIAAHSGNPEE